ncbi:F-box/LRR-repeat protein 6 isoform X2 [Phycodurus eques]|uniref:F-box/LRR-repeat protein 6 isoform X2 n=1 Tax=Phycodurus eques TaxID=693459 RepID=UPI002ACEBCE5|nr:F-box/LRR-repeat protein 6 isoform X2 [Phycodurus eques]
MMASTEGAVEDAGARASGQGDEAPKAQEASLKRKSAEPKKQTAKKKKKARANRTARPGYTVHEGEDMLLVISSSASQYDGSVWAPKKKRGKKNNAATSKGKGKKNTATKKKKSKTILRTAAVEEKGEEMFVAAKPSDHRWGQNLPEEVLVNIFKMVLTQDGAVPFLCRAARVCRLWNAAAATPVLWRRVAVGHCWVAPGKSQLPKTQSQIKDTLDWLAQNRFSQLRDFSLHHWSKNVDHAVDFQVEGLLAYLESHGAQIRQIWFTHGWKNDRVLASISRGCCPDLELLEVNTRLDSKDGELAVCVQALQAACPKLKTFRMLNIHPLHKSMRHAAQLSPGFPLLEELCIATASYSYVTDKYLRDILFGSPRLRVLDLRGCSQITSAGLAALPCLELECLFWGQYFSSHVVSSSLKKGLHAVTQKWKHTLRQLDVANQLFSEEDLELAMCHLASANNANTLHSLNLSGTRITLVALRSLIGQMTALDYLNLSSCRSLPRGLKRVYRGQEAIRQLLGKLE